MPLVLDNPNSGSGYYFDDPSNTAVPVAVDPVNMTAQTVAVGDNWVKVGNSYVGDRPAGPISGGTAALGWSAPNGLVEGDTLTISTDGTNSFGSNAPNFLFLMDTYNATGPTLTASDIEVGGGAVLDYTGGFDIGTTDKLGKAIKMGTSTPFATTQNGTAVQGKIWLDFPAHPRMFESRATYWPAANQANAEPMLSSGTNTWQLKNVWKMADRDFVATDTDFFVSGEGYAFYDPTDKFKSGTPVLSSNSVSTIYMNEGTATNDPTDVHNRPYPDVFFHEALCDQKNYDGTTANNVVEYRSARADVAASALVQRNNLVLAVPSAPTRVVNSFSYPGYVRGFSIPEDANFYESDLYFANGDGAACRVVISDNADYFQSTKYAAMRPLSWTNGQIEMKFRTGIFQGDLTGCHLNVIGEDNTQIGSIAL